VEKSVPPDLLQRLLQPFRPLMGGVSFYESINHGVLEYELLQRVILLMLLIP
jgi:hypothetical protein